MSIIKHVTLQKIVAHDFRYDPRNFIGPITLKMKELHESTVLRFSRSNKKKTPDLVRLQYMLTNQACRR